MSPRTISRTRASRYDVDSVISSVMTVQTEGTGFIDITEDVQRFLVEGGAREGMVTLFIRHTSASLTIQENADPDVLTDLLTSLERIAPTNGGWIHDAEGPDDMPAHIKTMVTATSLNVPVVRGQMALGTWQGIYLIEHRAKPHHREVVLQFIGAT